VREPLESNDLRAAWERNAAAFVAWARAPGHDSYWRFHRDLFLELVPPPRGRTLDLGCGEGRLGRDLAALGHDVVGVDASPTMVTAAREVSSGIEYHLGDAAALPFSDGSFDLVVLFMSLQDIDDLEGAVQESARVLVAGGRLCVAIVHPMNSAGTFAGSEASSPFVIEGSYLDRFRYADELARDGFEVRLESEHRPLDAYTEAIADAGLLIERLREPPVPESGLANLHSTRWRRIPLFLHLRAVKRVQV
jgi:SAM-dependent methyltransferase